MNQFIFEGKMTISQKRFFSQLSLRSIWANFQQNQLRTPGTLNLSLFELNFTVSPKFSCVTSKIFLELAASWLTHIVEPSSIEPVTGFSCQRKLKDFKVWPISAFHIKFDCILFVFIIHNLRLNIQSQKHLFLQRQHSTKKVCCLQLLIFLKRRQPLNISPFQNWGHRFSTRVAVTISSMYTLKKWQT